MFIFLGGSCDPTTWRKDVAIPLLDAKGVAYFNPQVADWDAADAAYKAQGIAGGMTEFEAQQKLAASALVFVIDGSTRAVASMLESLSFAGLGRRVFVSIENMPDGTVIAGQTVTGRELKDLNRARSYLRDELSRHPSASVHGSITEAVQAAADFVKSL